MSKRKKKVHHFKRRKVSGLKMSQQANTGLQMLAGAVVGAIAKRFIDAAIAKQTTVTIEPKTLAFIEGLGGLAIIYTQKNPLLQGVGIGFAAESAVKIAQEMKLISGPAIQYTNFRKLGVPRPNMSGASITPSVAGASIYNFPKATSVAGSRVKRFAAAS